MPELWTLGHTNRMEQLFFFGFAALVTVPITVLFCRHRIAHQKSVSFGTVCIGVSGATLITLICAIGTDLFKRAYWASIGDNPSLPRFVFFLVLGILVAVCFVPSAFIVGYYRSRSKK